MRKKKKDFSESILEEIQISTQQDGNIYFQKYEAIEVFIPKLNIFSIHIEHLKTTKPNFTELLMITGNPATTACSKLGKRLII